MPNVAQCGVIHWDIISMHVPLRELIIFFWATNYTLGNFVVLLILLILNFKEWVTNDPNVQKLMGHKKNIICFVSMIKERERERITCIATSNHQDFVCFGYVEVDKFWHPHVILIPIKWPSSFITIPAIPICFISIGLWLPFSLQSHVLLLYFSFEFWYLDNPNLKLIQRNFFLVIV